MTNRMLIGLSVLVAAGVTASSSVLAAGAGASARAHMNVPVKSLAKTVALSPKGVRRHLRARGYTNIHFIDRYLPVYKVRACRNGKKFKMNLNRWGKVRNRVKIGWCDGGYRGPRINGLTFPQIRRKLNNRGYHQVRFTDRRLPGYGARVCKNGKRFAVRLNRWGKVTSRDYRGRCGYSRRHHDSRRGSYIHYDGPGISITLKKGRH